MSFFKIRLKRSHSGYSSLEITKNPNRKVLKVKKRIGALLLIVALAISLGLIPAAPAAAHIETRPFTTDLIAGQYIDVGDVRVWNDTTNLYVQYVVDAPWVVTGSHLYVGKTPPMWSAPGQLPYSPDMQKSPSPGASYNPTTMTYTIPLLEIYAYQFVGKGQGKGKGKGLVPSDPGVEPCQWVYIAAHTDASNTRTEQEETAWSDGTQFGTNWAMYFEYHVQDIGTILQVSADTATAELSTNEVHSGDYSVHLATGNGQTKGTGVEARIAIELPEETTLDDIQSISWWVYSVTGYPPHIDITLDVDGDGTVDPEDMLTGEMNLNCTGAPKSIAQLETEIAYDTGWLQTFELTSGDGFDEIDDNTIFWVTKMGSGNLNAPSGTLADWKSGDITRITDPEGEMPTAIITGSAKVIKIEIELDNWVVESEVYVDDIEINLAS